MFSCLQILEAFLWFVLITLLNVTLIILTLSVSRLLNLLLRLVAFLLFLNLQCLASISRWIRSEERFSRNADNALVSLSLHNALPISSVLTPSQLYVFMPPNLGGFFMVRSYYPSECHADYFDFERIEALKPAIEACGISTLSQSPMLGFHKQMD